MGKPSGVRVTGALARYACGFGEELVRQGYTPHSASCQLQLMAHAGRWVAAGELGVGELTPVRVEEFLEDRRAEGYTLWLSMKAMAPVLAYLRGIGVVPTPSPVGAATAAEELLEHYRAYLVQNGAWRPAPWSATCTWPGCSWPPDHRRVNSVSNA